MQKNCSVKVTKASSLPASYRGSCEGDVEIAEYIRASKPEKKVTEKIKFNKDYFKKAKNILNGAKAYANSFLRKTAFSVKTSFENFCLSVKAFAKKAGLNAAVSLGLLLATVLFTALFCTVAYDVTLDGSEIGTIAEKSDFDKLIAEINDEILPYGEVTFRQTAEPEFSPKLILKGNVTGSALMKEKIKSTSSEMIPAYAVTVDGVPAFALASAEIAADVLNTYKQKCTEGMTDATITFLNDVEIAHIFVPKTMLKSKETALLKLSEGRHIHYDATDGETLKSIAEKNNVTVEEILLSNTIENPENMTAQRINIYTGEPVIGVKVTEYVDETQTILCDTETVNDSEKYIGTIEIKNEGADGEKQVKAYVTTVNGVEVERDIISETILSEPITRVEVVGTKEKPSPYGTGDFSMPASGQLSSRFGSRWGRTHKGIDVAANEGTPIYAADNGTVVYSKFNDGGYGYLIEIDHQNGYVTYYAHCSKLVVNEGDVVAKGDLIGYVGNTGRSTGAHLHFEVRKNGEPCDPLEFVG